MSEHVEQNLPKINDNAYIHDLVCEDHQDRKIIGTERYGTPLQADNGRDALRDAYEEVLDQSVYLRQVIEERNLALSDLRSRMHEILDGAVQWKNLDGEYLDPILEALVRAATPFVTSEGKRPVVRWHGHGGTTKEIAFSTPVDFPGGKGAFSLTFE
jgi:hypothetical protein